VRRHDAAFGIPKSESGVMPPHSKAPSARKSGQVMVRVHVPKLGDFPDFFTACQEF
jgi:hypothetical protein